MKITKSLLKEMIKEELTPEKTREYDLDFVKHALNSAKRSLRDDIVKGDLETAIKMLAKHVPELGE